ncbi:unnamed protein product [Linum trigynum]|uniref:Uncharacterized protein n=1 Tax=Linum trigynum TaxID=586398 RepID=A0AAV2EVK5_9ROSI
MRILSFNCVILSSPSLSSLAFSTASDFGLQFLDLKSKRRLVWDGHWNERLLPADPCRGGVFLGMGSDPTESVRPLLTAGGFWIWDRDEIWGLK